MIRLKVTEEYRTDSELEAKEEMDKMRLEAEEKGYKLGACGYTYKAKKAKGEIIDEAWVIKAVKEYRGVWDNE